jgi:hypothetical protein
MSSMVGWNRRGPRKIAAEVARPIVDDSGPTGDARLGPEARSPFPTARRAASAVPVAPSYLSVDEAAAVLRVDRKTIHRAVAAGEFAVGRPFHVGPPGGEEVARVYSMPPEFGEATVLADDVGPAFVEALRGKPSHRSSLRRPLDELEAA